MVDFDNEFVDNKNIKEYIKVKDDKKLMQNKTF